MSDEDSYILVSARYDSVADAEAGYQAVRTAYASAGNDDFDAAVYTRDRQGRFILHFGTAAPDVESTGGRDLAERVGKSVFESPAPTGSEAGAERVDASSSTGDEVAPREDLQRLAAVIRPGSAAVLVAYRPDLEPLVTSNLHSDATAVSHEIHASETELRSQVHDARKSAHTRSNRGATGV